MKALGVASGKGGVGKTYVAATIIQDLLSRGYRVGAADFDISNPNLGRMLQVTAEAEVDIDKKIHPAETPNGLQFFSIEHVLRDKGIGMTGEEYAAIIKDVVEQGLWHVDYFVVDLPAVISNEFRAVIALFSENYIGTVVVAQPSHLATAERVLKLHELNGIPVIGIAENMTDFVCFSPESVFLMDDGSIYPAPLLSTYGDFLGIKTKYSTFGYVAPSPGMVSTIPSSRLMRIQSGLGFIDVTPNHLFYVQKREPHHPTRLLQANQLCVGDYIPYMLHQRIHPPRKDRKDRLMELAGYLLGDGHITNGPSNEYVRAWDKNPENLEYYSNVFEEVYGKRPHIHSVNGENGYRLQIGHSQAVQELLSFYNRNPTYASPSIFAKGNASVSQFLRGLFDAEGSVGNGSVCFYTSSVFLAQQVQTSLLRFGVLMALRERENTNPSNPFDRNLRLYVGWISDRESISNFANKIGFNDKKKRERLLELLALTRDRQTRNHYRNFQYRGNPTHIWIPIVSIEEKSNPTGFVYSIRTKTENLIVNGIGIHNCPNCQTSYKIFGESGSDALGEKYHVPVLAKIPVTMTVQERLREHMPVTIVDAAQVKAIGDAVVNMEPRKLGFMQEIAQKVKHYVRDEVIKLLTTSLIIINSSVNVGELQRLHNFMQKQVIKFVIMDDRMENPIATQVYRVVNGKIMYVDESDPRVDNPDVWIYIKAAALAWAFLGKKKFPDGKEVPYDIMDAWANDDARVYGPGAVARAIAFYRDLWYQSREQVTPRLAPLLEKLI